MKPQVAVAAGYDAIAERFGEWRAEIVGSPDEEWLGDLLFRLTKEADVLELGCGQGMTARRIVDAGHRYTGVDISAEQLRRARALVPEAELRQADLTQVACEAESLDAVVSLYVFNHLPRADLPGLFGGSPSGYGLAAISWRRSGDPAQRASPASRPSASRSSRSSSLTRERGTSSGSLRVHEAAPLACGIA